MKKLIRKASDQLIRRRVGDFNALAHRDYHSNASVEIRLFPDRLEVWNPGLLPSTLTLESLATDHPSVPANPLLAESLYLARYIEKAGSGTLSMIDLCAAADLPSPDFEIRNGSFVVTLWRDWLTDEVLGALNLNDRQLAAISHLRNHPKISSAEYQHLTQCSRRTATRDLGDLAEIGLLVFHGKGRGAHYRLTKNRAKIEPNAPEKPNQ